MKTIGLEIKWALIFTGAGLLWMVLEKLLGWHDEHIGKHFIYTNIFGIVAILLYVLALRDKRRQLGGTMSWLEGFKSGAIITVIIGLLAPLSQYLTSTLISPEYFTNAIEHTVEIGQKSQEEAEKFFSLGNYIVMATGGAIAMGLLTSAVVAFFVKSK